MRPIKYVATVEVKSQMNYLHLKMLKKLRLIHTQAFLNIIQSCQMHLAKQGSQVSSILVGTITLSKLFNILVLDQVLDSIDKGIKND